MPNCHKDLELLLDSPQGRPNFARKSYSSRWSMVRIGRASGTDNGRPCKLCLKTELQGGRIVLGGKILPIDPMVSGSNPPSAKIYLRVKSR